MAEPLPWLPDTRVLGAPVPPRDRPDLDRVATEQSGLLTRQQCLGVGLTDDAIRWRLERGWWVAMHAGVYLTVPGRDDWWTRALAAQLAVGRLRVVAPRRRVRPRHRLGATPDGRSPHRPRPPGRDADRRADYPSARRREPVR